MVRWMNELTKRSRDRCEEELRQMIGEWIVGWMGKGWMDEWMDG